MTRILVVTAVEAERTAILAGAASHGRAIDWHEPSQDLHTVDVAIAGVGPAAAAACAAVTLTVAGARGRPYHQVLCMGIGGAFADRAAIGEIAIGTRSIAADLGATSPEGFLPVETLGFGRNAFDADATLTTALRAALPGAREGEILTVSTVTGSAERADDLADRFPDAVIEAMEGFGVATAAEAAGVAFAEVRTVSNLVGPRDRAAWRIGDALAALSTVGTAVGTLIR